MTDWITGLVERMGYLGIAFLMFLENVFPPIPSELIMPLGGFVAAQGELSLAWVCVWGTVGSIVGQLPLYYLGRGLGEERIKALADRYGKWILLSRSDVERSSEWFGKHGGKAVFFCRLVPGVRSLISIPAGIRRMPLRRFLAFSAIGMGLWASALAWAGHALGNHYEKVSTFLGPVSYVIFGLLLISFTVWVTRKRRRRSARRRSVEL